MPTRVRILVLGHEADQPASQAVRAFAHPEPDTPQDQVAVGPPMTGTRPPSGAPRASRTDCSTDQVASAAASMSSEVAAARERVFD